MRPAKIITDICLGFFVDFLLLQCVQYKAPLFTANTLLGKKKHFIAFPALYFSILDYLLEGLPSVSRK